MTCLYYLLELSFVGILSIFNIKGCLIFLILFIVCLLMIICMKKNHIYNNKTYKVIIILNNKTIELEGFLDTGNMASYFDTPIIFLNKKFYNKNLKVDYLAKLKTVNDIQYINCYKPEKFYIIDNNKKIAKDVLISFSNFDNDISCLLNNLMFC